MTTHNDWRPKYTARLHELWRQERDAGSRPEAADLTTASQQDFIALAQRSKDRRDDALKRKIDKLLDKARILTDERRAEVERAARRLAAQHTDPEGVNAWLTQFFHPDSDEPPRPPRSEAPETLFDIDDYAARMPGGGVRAIQGR
jgi:hypothetical protein